MEGIEEMIAVAGLGVVSWVGEKILTNAGHNEHAIVLSILSFVAASFIGIKVMLEGADFIEDVFHLH